MRFNIIALILIGVLCQKELRAQEEGSSFDSVYVQAATSMAALDIQKAIRVADSLYIHAENSLQQMKSLMLLATLTGRVGDKVQALTHAINAEKIAKKSKNLQWQIRISGFLSTTFRERNLIEEGEKYFNIAEDAIKKLDQNTPGLSTIRALMHQEKAYYRIGEKNFIAAVEELHKAEAEFFKTEEGNRSKTFLALNYQLLGSCYLAQKEYDLARDMLTRALDELGEEASELKAFIYTDFAELKMQEEDYGAAFDFFNSAEAYLETSDNFNLKSSLFKGLSNYYKAVGNQTEAIRYSELYTDYVRDFSMSTKSISDQLIKQLRVEKETTAKRNALLTTAFLILGTVLVGMAFYFRTVRKADRERYAKLLARMEKSSSMLDETKGKYLQKRNSQEALAMPKETIERIMEELRKWEDGYGFLNKSLSLSALAVELNTNPKYLSNVINTHKGKDFNNYVNELKVLYIIDKLRDHPEYLNYKLSYLAEELGFSSHSKFASVFKSIVGVPPSVFISRLKEETLTHA